MASWHDSEKEKRQKPVSKSTIFRDDFNQVPPEEREVIPNYKDLAAEAKAKGLWIFDPGHKEWMNPDEFISHYSNYISGHEKIMKRVILKDPIEAIEAGHKKLLEFTTRVLEYSKKKKA